MTPKETFKIACLSRFVDAGLSFDEITEHVDRIHDQLTKQASMVAPCNPPKTLMAPRESSISTKPMTGSNVGVSLPSATKQALFEGLMNAGGKAVDFMTSKALPAAIIAPALGGAALGYGVGKMTDVDDTDIDEMKSRELIDQYKRWTTHIQQQQKMKDRLQATERPHYNRY